MKRVLSLILALAILITAIPGLAFAGKPLPYTYAPVRITLANQEHLLDETDFRQWAAEKLAAYRDEYLYRQPFELYDEYYRLASYKKWFDEVFGKETNTFGDVIRSIEYTSETMTEEQLDEMYLKVMLDSLAEMKQTDPDYLTKYLAKSDEERKIYTLGANGEWQENTMLKAVDDKAEADFVNEMAGLIADAADLAISTYVSYAAPSNSDLIGSLTGVATTAIKEISKTATENFKSSAENKIKNYLAEQMINTLSEVRRADIACLKTVYLNNPGQTDERVARTAQKIIDYYESNEMTLQLIREGEIQAGNQVGKALDTLGLELQEVLETQEIIIISAMDIVRLSLEEVLDQVISKLNVGESTFGNGSSGKKAALGQGEQAWNNLIFSLLKELIDTICDNIEEDWLETGSLDVSAGFRFDDEDWNGFLKKINIFSIVSDTATLKKARESMNKNGKSTNAAVQALQMDVGLGGRFAYVLCYYMLLELPEAAIDEMIDQKTKEDYTENALKSVLNNITPFVKDLFAVALDYACEQIEGRETAAIEAEKQRKLNEIKKARENKEVRKNASEKMKTEVRQTASSKLSKLKKELEEKVKPFKVVTDVAQKAWNVGEDIVDTYYAGVDSLSGEDGMSLLAQEVVTAKELSLPLTMPIRECIPSAVTDANKMSVAQVWSLVSKMKQAIAYDASGTNAYYNVDLQGRDQRKNTDFMKLLNGGKIFRYSVVHLFTQTGYITYDYQNVYGNQGLLTLDEALVIRNATVEWKNELNEGWKDEWLMLPGIAK